MKRLFDLASAACDEIQQLDPDLLLVLAHGGWAALWATQALWDETKDLPFPKVLVTNLGREKIDRYEAIRSTVPCVEITPFVADYAGDYETGYFLAWLSQQSDWQAALQRQVLEALGGQPPQKILVLDDTTWEGGTYRLVLGLMAEIFPSCEVRTLAGNLLDWRDDFYVPWLLDHHLELDREKDKEMNRRVYHLIPGTEDVEAQSSFDWRRITTGSQIVQALSSLLPAETWLELPVWAEREIRQGMIELHRQGQFSNEEEKRWVSRPFLHPEEIVIKHVWLHERITRRETAAMLQITATKAGALLAQLVGDSELLPQGRGRGRFYILPPDATIHPNQRPPKPLLDAYWVEQNNLMVGEAINGWEIKVARKQIDWLLSQGIRCWIDLEERDHVETVKTYEKTLQARSHRLGMEIRSLSLPIENHWLPSKDQVQAVLDMISAAVAAGQPVYVHRYGNEVISVIAGCYLVLQGFNGDQALEELVRLRQDTYEPWRLAPARAAARRMIKRWGRGVTGSGRRTSTRGESPGSRPVR